MKKKIFHSISAGPDKRVSCSCHDFRFDYRLKRCHRFVRSSNRFTRQSRVRLKRSYELPPTSTRRFNTNYLRGALEKHVSRPILTICHGWDRSHGTTSCKKTHVPTPEFSFPLRNSVNARARARSPVGSFATRRPPRGFWRSIVPSYSLSTPGFGPHPRRNESRVHTPRVRARGGEGTRSRPPRPNRARRSSENVSPAEAEEEVEEDARGSWRVTPNHPPHPPYVFIRSAVRGRRRVSGSYITVVGDSSPTEWSPPDRMIDSTTYDIFYVRATPPPLRCPPYPSAATTRRPCDDNNTITSSCCLYTSA